MCLPSREGPLGTAIGRTLQLNPDAADACIYAGDILLKAHKEPEALQMFTRYLQLAPKGPYAEQTRKVIDKLKKRIGRSVWPGVPVPRVEREALIPAVCLQVILAAPQNRSFSFAARDKSEHKFLWTRIQQIERDPRPRRLFFSTTRALSEGTVSMPTPTWISGTPRSS